MVSHILRYVIASQENSHHYDFACVCEGDLCNGVGAQYPEEPETTTLSVHGTVRLLMNDCTLSESLPLVAKMYQYCNEYRVLRVVTLVL